MAQPRQGREHRGGEELRTPDRTGHYWTRALENNAFDRYTERVCTSWDAPLQGASVTWLGGMVRRRQRHHSGLWCDVFTTELKVERGVDIRSLTARKHTVRSRKGEMLQMQPLQAFSQLIPFSRESSPPR